MASSWCGRVFRLLGAASVVAAAVTAGSGAAGVVVEGAVVDLQEVLETRVTRLRNDTGLTAVAAAVMVDGQLAGLPSAAIAGETAASR